MQQLQLRASAAVDLERERLDAARSLINERYDAEAQAPSADTARP